MDVSSSDNSVDDFIDQLLAERPTFRASAPEYSRADLIFVAKRRRAEIDGRLRQMTGSELAVELGALSFEERGALQQQRAARASITRQRTVESLRSQLRAAGLPSTGQTKDEMADAILAMRPPPLELDADQKAALDRVTDAGQLLISAGPGAGKTTTICHMAAAISAASESARVLILAYNREAEATLLQRLGVLGVRLIPKTQVAADGYTGVAVMTFDKFGYRIALADNGVDDAADALASVYGDEEPEPAEPGPTPTLTPLKPTMPAGGHRVALERATAVLGRVESRLYEWDAVIIDEAQDVGQNYASFIAALLQHRRPRLLIVAGDPRQELYAGATWFGNLWAAAPPREKIVLRFNHRSARRIVAWLNAFSRANFPTLHHDQIATRDCEGVAEFRTVPAGDRWWVRREPGRMSADVGGAIGRLIAAAEEGAAYAVAPVTTAKFGFEPVTMAIRQAIYEANPNAKVALAASGDRCLLRRHYEIATSKKIKGTERDRVVVFGADLGYEVCVDRAALVKSVFVALSRARDALYVVQRPPDGIARAILAPLELYFDQPLPQLKAIEAPVRSDPEVIPVVGPESTGGGLADSVAIARPSTTQLEGLPPLAIDIQSDADFVGCYVEALLAIELGVDIRTTDVELVVGVREDFGFSRNPHTGALRLCASNVAIAYLEAHLAQKHVAANPAYVAAMLNFTNAAGQPWTVSSRLAAADPGLAAGVAAVNAALAARVTSPLLAGYPYSARHDLFPARDGGEVKALGRIGYTPDLRFASGTVLELKHTAALTDAHRRQAAIYAALLGCPDALLISTRAGLAERVAAADLVEVERVSRAMIELRAARSRALTKHAPTAVRLPPSFRDCVVALGAETDAGRVIELGAVAFSASDWSVLGVYGALADGVRPMTSIELSRQARSKPVVRSAAMAGLVVDGEHSAARLISGFRDWVASVSGVRTFIHWGGPEKELVAGLGEVFDVRQAFYLPWLDRGASSNAGSTLESAHAQCLPPNVTFLPHRAFEDAIATAGIFAALVNCEGAL